MKQWENKRESRLISVQNVQAVVTFLIRTIICTIRGSAPQAWPTKDKHICQEPRNELQLFWLGDRYSAIWIDPSGPTITESIGCCLLSGHGQACPQTHHSSQASHTKQNKMMPACLRSCNLQCGPAQGCGPVGGRRLKSKLFNRYVIVFDCGRDHADHVFVGT